MNTHGKRSMAHPWTRLRCRSNDQPNNGTRCPCSTCHKVLGSKRPNVTTLVAASGQHRSQRWWASGATVFIIYVQVSTCTSHWFQQKGVTHMRNWPAKMKCLTLAGSRSLCLIGRGRIKRDGYNSDLAFCFHNYVFMVYPQIWRHCL